MKKFMTGKAQIFLGLMLIFSGILLSGDKQAYAATKVQVTSVDYYHENILVNNGSNTKIYFATDTDAAKNNWEVMPVDSGTYTAIDTSWTTAIAENVILVKGDVDTDPVRITIKEKPKKLDITINYTNMDKLLPTASIASIVNIMTTEGTGSDPIAFDDLEWKKSETGTWTSTSSLTVGMLEKYLIKGTYLYFRIAAVNDDLSGTVYPDGTDGRRFSDEVKLRIEKKAPSMVYGIDGSKFTAAIKYGKEYRVTVTYPNNTTGKSDWVKVIDKASLPIALDTMVNGVTPRYYSGSNLITYDGKTVAFPKILIEVRNYSTSKAASSKISEIAINNQRTITKPIVKGTPAVDAITTGDDNVYVAYNGNKSLTITVPLATTALPYEYCIVKPGETLDLARASWTSITKGTAIKVLASKAVDGGKLYIRMKEIKSKKATDTISAIEYALASTYVTMDLNYPSIPTATSTTLTYVKGYPTPLVFYVQLNVNGKLPYETTIKNIKLGTKEIGFTPENYTLATDSTVACIKVTLNGDEVKLLANSTNKALAITYMNGTVDKTSIKITIKSPTVAGSLIASAVKGSATGTTAIKMDSIVGSGNTFVYIISTDIVTGKNSEDTIASGTYSVFTSGADISNAAGKYITIYEIKSSSTGNATSNIINYKSIQITSDFIL